MCRTLKGGADVDYMHVWMEGGGAECCATPLIPAALFERDKFGRTPLHRALSYGNTGAIFCLLKHGADVSAADNQGISPLLIAVGEDCHGAPDL